MEGRKEGKTSRCGFLSGLLDQLLARSYEQYSDGELIKTNEMAFFILNHLCPYRAIRI